MKTYSIVYVKEGENRFGFRYNYTDALLESVSKWDFRKVDGEWKDVILENWEVTSAVGLSREDWDENPQYWIDTYQVEIDDECNNILATEFIEEVGGQEPKEYGPGNPWDAPGMKVSDFVDFKVMI